MDPERLKTSDLEQVRSEIRGEIERWMAQHERRDADRFGQLMAGQETLQRGMDEMNGRVSRINAEIGYGLPEPEERGGRLTLRDRMHALEDAKHAATAAGAALGLLFGRITRWFIVVGVVVAAVGTILRLFGIGG